MNQVVQYQATTSGDNGTSSAGNWNVTLTNVQAGSTLYVVGTWPNFSSTYPDMAVTDNMGSTYTQLARLDDGALFNCGIQGTQSMAHWYVSNVAAGNYVINMAPVSNSLGTSEDYVGIVAFEIAGSSSAPVLDGSNLVVQQNLALATDAVSVPVTASGSSGLLVAVTEDIVDSVGGPNLSYCPANAATVPLPGSGFTDNGPLWNFFGDGVHYAGRAESQAVSGAGSHAATFTPQEGSSDGAADQLPDYLSAGAIFR